MKTRAEEAIERTLAGLREAETPEGMERRVLAAVRLRVREAGAGGRGSRWAWGAAVAGAVVICAGAYLAGSKVEELRVVPVARVAVRTLPQEVTHAVGGGVARATPPVWKRRYVTHPVERAAVVTDGEEDLAWSEMRARSMPAPEQPLTEQERLLLRVVHRGDPVEIAMLDPEKREAATAAEKAEVQHFFEAARTTENQ